MFRTALASVTVVLLGALAMPLTPRLEASAGSSRLNSAHKTPVLVELFTSEGCSDCPPADTLLQKLDKSQPVAGAEVVVLSEHVDYWDDIGWKDPYSSHAFSERQSAYAGGFRLRSIYTPQMVVDGRIELVGSDESGAIEAIRNAAKTEKISVILSAIRPDGTNTITLHIETAALPSGVSAESVDVLVAVADESDESHVSRGENAGRTLHHVAVVRTLTLVGTAEKGSSFSKDAKIHLDGRTLRNVRLVAFVQDKSGRIWGMGSGRLPN
jgi:hypothetical protein